MIQDVQARTPPSTLATAKTMAAVATPWALIGGLLWAGLTIKPEPVGSTVERPLVERRDNFYTVAMPAADLLWTAGSNGKILRSEDGGASWAAQSSATERTLQSLAAWDASRAVAVGNSGTILVTSDGGASWNRVQAFPAGAAPRVLLKAVTAADGRAWVVGELGTILATEDWGATWTALRAEEDLAFNDIAVTPSGELWVVGEYGRMLRSGDGGRNWRTVSGEDGISLMAVAFRDDAHGVSVGLEGRILATSDGGETWRPVSSGTSDHLFAVAWDSAQRAWLAVGAKGVAVTGDETGWRAGSLRDGELAWHTAVLVQHGRAITAGRTLLARADGTWSSLLPAPGRAPVSGETQ